MPRRSCYQIWLQSLPSKSGSSSCWQISYCLFSINQCSGFINILLDRRCQQEPSYRFSNSSTGKNLALEQWTARVDLIMKICCSYLTKVHLFNHEDIVLLFDQSAFFQKSCYNRTDNNFNKAQNYFSNVKMPTSFGIWPIQLCHQQTVLGSKRDSQQGSWSRLLYLEHTAISRHHFHHFLQLPADHHQKLNEFM